MERWNDRVALVTDASYGIGEAICKELVKYGIIVVGCARNVKKIEKLAQTEEVVASPGKWHALKCDMSEETEILAMFDEIKSRFGRIDICINNAGVMLRSPLMSGCTRHWKYIIEANVLGTCICSREALKLMKEKEIQDGVIIQMGSNVGHKIPSIPKGTEDPGFAIYNGTKFMIRALADALRQELKSQSSLIRVSTISPGVVVTDLLNKAITPSETVAPEFFGSLKFLQLQDIVDAVVYILKCPAHMSVDDIVIQSVDFHI